MSPTLSPQQFVQRWRSADQKERAISQPHFLDLCDLIEHPKPADLDPSGTWFAFEVGVNKTSGGDGFADVWKRGSFAWEYKGKHANLGKAYEQLLKYRESLQNPPLLIVSDIDTIVVHTNFTNTVKRVVTITLDDLLKPEGMRALRAIFDNPEYFRAEQTTEQVTQTAAAKFAELAEHLRQQGPEKENNPEAIAHFLIRLLFCLFAEDIDLLPNKLFTELVTNFRTRPERFSTSLASLFAAMATGGAFGADDIRHFNGGLFDDNRVLELGYDGLKILQEIAALDWGSIEPSILGTLFERSLDPSKRSQLGAHYTSRDDILLLVEPVLMAPLRRQWAATQAAALELAERRDKTTDAGQRTRRQNELRGLLLDFVEQIAKTRVLDPACGSGNFLYVALRQMLDLEKEVSQFASTVGLPALFPQSSPAQLFGIELNEYAHELAQATVWIGYIQWLHENGYGVPSEPILKRLDNIKQMDAILAFDTNGKPVEPEWPEAEVIVGNPPFLGGKRIRTELGSNYVDSMFTLYDERVPKEADLVCYWFEKARSLIELGKYRRAGLLATNSIRGGANREVLERIRQSGEIFMAWSDRPWVLDGAAVRVSLVGFDDGSESFIHLDGKNVAAINPDLTSAADLTIAQRLAENIGLAFMGVTPAGPFDIPDSTANNWIALAGNPNGRPNSDVVKPYYNGIDITRRPRGVWIIDFGVDMPLDEAALYERPFEFIYEHVFPVRQTNNRETYRVKWWLHAEPRPAMRKALLPLSRYIGTSMVAKHRTFSWIRPNVLPANLIIIIAKEDDYIFGVLQSHFHEIWSLRMGTRLGVGNDPRYTPTTTFETYPFPWPPGKEPIDDPRVLAIAEAARELNSKRENWLNPPDISEAELKKRTLTNLYNARPTWLDLAHRKLDAAVAAAYGWPADLPDEEILARLLALNLQRATNTPPP